MKRLLLYTVMLVSSLVLIAMFGCHPLDMKQGELGRGWFIYRCIDVQNDSACNNAAVPAFPSTVAVGSRISIGYQSNEEAEYIVVAGSSTHLGGGGISSGLEVLKNGPVGLMALDYNRDVFDLIHLMARQIATIALSDDSQNNSASAYNVMTDLELAVDETSAIKAFPLDESNLELAGSLSYSWSVADSDIVEISLSDSTGRTASIKGIAPGTTTVEVTVGGVDSELNVEVILNEE